MKTGYVVLKQHFNKLIFGGYPASNGLEPVRDSYAKTFGKKINLYDVYRTPFRAAGNPIESIITLIGPDDPNGEMSEGIIACEREITSINIISESILKGIDETMIDEYTQEVFNAMKRVIEMDRSYKSSAQAKGNPYLQVVRFLPLYLTFHHEFECISNVMNERVFLDLIEKYYVAGDSAVKLLESMKTKKYTEDIAEIYNTLTCDNTIDL